MVPAGLSACQARPAAPELVLDGLRRFLSGGRKSCGTLAARRVLRAAAVPLLRAAAAASVASLDGSSVGDRRHRGRPCHDPDRSSNRARSALHSLAGHLLEHNPGQWTGVSLDAFSAELFRGAQPMFPGWKMSNPALTMSF